MSAPEAVQIVEWGLISFECKEHAEKRSSVE